MSEHFQKYKFPENSHLCELASTRAEIVLLHRNYFLCEAFGRPHIVSILLKFHNLHVIKLVNAFKICPPLSCKFCSKSASFVGNHLSFVLEIILVQINFCRLDISPLYFCRFGRKGLYRKLVFFYLTLLISSIS